MEEISQGNLFLAKVSNQYRCLRFCNIVSIAKLTKLSLLDI